MSTELAVTCQTCISYRSINVLHGDCTNKKALADYPGEIDALLVRPEHTCEHHADKAKCPFRAAFRGVEARD